MHFKLHALFTNIWGVLPSDVPHGCRYDKHSCRGWSVQEPTGNSELLKEAA